MKYRFYFYFEFYVLLKLYLLNSSIFKENIQKEYRG